MQVEFTSYGLASLTTLRRRVAAVKAGDPMATVTIIVPNNVAGIVTRRHLAAGLGDGRAGVAALDVTTLERLAERLAAASLAPRRPVTPAVLSAAWRRALATDPGVFAEVAGHPATVQALAAAHRALSDVDETGLTAIAELGGLAAEVVRLHRVVLAALGSNWYDVPALLEAATAVSHTTHFGTVILYLPQDLNRAQAGFATALATDRTDFSVVCALTGVRRADAAVTRWLRRAGVDIPSGPAPTTATRMVNASDSDDEVRCVVRQVAHALTKTPAHRIAVLYTATSPYGRLLHEHLAAAGITVNGAGPRAVSERAIPRTVAALLGLMDGDVARVDLFRALAGTPVRDFDGNRIPLSRWERNSRNAGVVKGNDWATRLGRLIHTEEAQIVAEQTSEDPQDWQIDRSRQTIESAEGLRTFVARLRSELGAAEEKSTWRDLTDWALELFQTLVGGAETLRRLPPEEQYAAAAVTSNLAALSNLDAVDTAASLTGLREALEMALASSLPRVGRFGDGVHVGPVSAAVGLDLDVVFVLGLSEDLYPGRMHEDALLPERVRAVVQDQLPSSRDAVNRQHRHLLAALASAPTAVASFPRGNLRRSTVRIPSRFILPSLRHLSGDHLLPATEWDDADYSGDMVTSGSFAGELLQTTALVHEQEWRTRQAAASGRLDDAVVQAGLTMNEARAEEGFSRFDGNLSGAEGLPDYAAGVRMISPTALESYAACPHAFFVRRLLGVEPVEQPEDLIVISPAQIGTFVHGVVDDLIRESAGDLPGHGKPWTAAQRARLLVLAKVEAEALTDQGLTGHPRLWQREQQRIMNDLVWMLDDDDAWRFSEQAQVLASEMSFGLQGTTPVHLALPRGTVLMRGSADRVDQKLDGTLIVTDIKTGSRKSFDKITDDDPFVGGTKLQLPVYALAARARFGGPSIPVRSAYWFVRRDRGSRKEILLTPEVERHYVETIAILVDSIADGLFPLKAPATPDFSWVQCAYCNPDGVGYGDLREAWQRKHPDQALRRLIGLIDPEAAAALANEAVRS